MDAQGKTRRKMSLDELLRGEQEERKRRERGEQEESWLRAPRDWLRPPRGWLRPGGEVYVRGVHTPVFYTTSSLFRVEGEGDGNLKGSGEDRIGKEI